jgi:hypothetical protein
MNIKQYSVALALLALAACGGKDEKAKVEEPPKQEALSKSKNSPAFNASFTPVVDNYFHLKDNFITESIPAIEIYAQKLQKNVAEIKFAELKADPAIVETAKNINTNLAAELKTLLAEKELKGKLKSFNNVTDQIYNLIRTVQYDREVIYHQHCPMAFNEGDANAFWLSRTNEIRNPYLPKTMLTCGDVADSLDYRSK